MALHFPRILLLSQGARRLREVLERGLEQTALNVTTCQRNSHLVGPVGLVLERHPQPHAFSPRLTSAAKGCLLLLDTCNEIRFSMKTEGKMRSENAPGED